MKQFFPDLAYSRKKRLQSVGLFAILFILIGGFAAYLYINSQPMLAGVMLIFLVIPLATIPSAFMNYPTKMVPLIEVNGTRVKLRGDKTEYKASEITAASVIIDVPQIKGTAEERMAELKRIASVKPTVPVIGTCDLIVKNAKGKEETKYNIVSDCIGALDALLTAGVKKYRIIYCMKKLNTQASYPMTLSAEKGTLSELNEKERMNQLI